jgi:hypothetical protein
VGACARNEPAPTPITVAPPITAAAPVEQAKPRYDPAIVQRGEALHAKALAKTGDAKLNVWGSGFPTVKACIWIPEGDWDSLSTEDREALVTYLKAQIPIIRSNPERYTSAPSSAPAYSRIRSNIANMRDDAFVIFSMIRKDGQWLQSGTVAESK